MAGFNYREYKRYRDNFKKMTEHFNKWLRSFMYLQGMKYLGEVKPRTPVDTGDLRSHWQIDNIVVAGEDITCWFVNPMEYATFVEYGHAKPYKSGAAIGSEDWVDGSFMMTLSLEVIERELPSEFNAAFNEFLRGWGVD